MKQALLALAGALLGGFLAVILGSASAIREANDRAAEARDLANAALKTSEDQAKVLGATRAELSLLKGGADAR